MKINSRYIISKISLNCNTGDIEINNYTVKVNDERFVTIKETNELLKKKYLNMLNKNKLEEFKNCMDIEYFLDNLKVINNKKYIIFYSNINVKNEDNREGILDILKYFSRLNEEKISTKISKLKEKLKMLEYEHSKHLNNWFENKFFK